MCIIETIYYITAGPCLLTVAIIGLRSLMIAQKAIDTTELRSVLNATATQIEKFTNEIVPKFDALDSFIKENNITFFDGWDLVLENEQVLVSRSEDFEDPEEFSKCLDLFVPANNALSAWSSYFTTGVADEHVAYQTVAHDFLIMAERCVPITIMLSEEQTSHEDQISLYHVWAARKQHESAYRDAEDIMEKLDKLEQIRK